MIQRTWAATRNAVIFNRDAEKLATNGLILAERQSLAGSSPRWNRSPVSRPADDLIVRLPDTVTVEEPDSADPSLRITHEPVRSQVALSDSSSLSALSMMPRPLARPPLQPRHTRIRRAGRSDRRSTGDRQRRRDPPIHRRTDRDFTRSTLMAGISMARADARKRFVVQAWMRALVRLKPTVCFPPATKRGNTSAMKPGLIYGQRKDHIIGPL